MLRGIVTLVYRECLQCFRKRAELLNPLLFFIMVAALFPLATTPNDQILVIIGPGIIWVAALLATLLSLTHLFKSDYQDGTLEQLTLNSLPLSLVVVGKVLAYWLIYQLPLIIMSPLLAMMFHLTMHATWILMLSLLLGTPTLSFLGAIAAGLTVGLRNAGFLLALVLLPLFVPALIFGSSAVINAQQGLLVSGQLLVLSVFFVLSATLAPVTAAYALRISLAI